VDTRTRQNHPHQGRVFLAIGVLGILARAAQYLYNRSLWIDEAMLALNIQRRSFGGLLGTLDNWQVAPPGFLLIVKALVAGLGDNEYVLRLLPFVAGIAAVFLFYEVGRRLLTRNGLIVALLLFACSTWLIRYSAELKQYSSDACLALLALLATLSWLDHPRSWPRYVLLCTVGAVAIWLSTPAVFVLAGGGTVCLVETIRHRSTGRLVGLGLVFLGWGISLAFCYLVLQNNANIAAQRNLNHWNDAWAPLPPLSLADIAWYKAAIEKMMAQPGAFTSSPALAIVSLLVGWAVFFKQQQRTFLLLVLPLVFALIASGLHVYPFRDRTLVFALPMVLLAVGEGVEHIRARLVQATMLGAVVFVLLVVLFPVVAGMKLITHPIVIEEIKPALEYLREHRRPDDTVYVYYGATKAFAYYAPRYGLGDDYIAGSWGKSHPDEPEFRLYDYIEDVVSLRGRDRVWLLFENHRGKKHKVPPEPFILCFCDMFGTRVDTFKGQTAALYLYDLSGGEVDQKLRVATPVTLPAAEP